MNKLLLLIIALMALSIVDCNALNPVRGSGIAYHVPKFKEPSWEEEEFELCRKNQWIGLPDSLKTNPLAVTLANAYNAYIVFNSVYSDCELHVCNHIYTGEGIRDLDISVIDDSEVRSYAIAYRMSMARSQKSSPPMFREAISGFSYVLANIYSLERIMGNDSVFNHAEYKASINLDSLRSDSFSLCCIQAIELAHDTADGKPNFEALPKLVELLTSGHYSPLLFKVWKTWRAMICSQMGQTKESYIPNEEYNRLRRIGCCTMLCHILDYPDDWVAVNHYLLMIAERNVAIYGNNTFGNQSLTTFYEMFPEFAPVSGGYK